MASSVLCPVLLCFAVVLLHGCGNEPEPKPEPKSVTAKWSHQVGGKLNQPVFGADGTIFVTSQDGVLHSFDGQDGSLRWRCGNSSSFFFGVPKIEEDGTVFIKSSEGGRTVLHSLDGQNGSLKWQTNGSSLHPNNFQITDNTVFLGDYGKIYALDKQNGSQKWCFDAHDTSTRQSVSIFFTHGADGTVLGTSEHGMIALHGENGTLKWNYSHDTDTERWQIARPARDADGTVYWPIPDEGLMMAMREEDGSVVWNFSTGAKYPVVAPGKDGLVYVTGIVGPNFGPDRHGQLWALQSKDGSVIWSFGLDEGIQDGCEGPILVLDPDGTIFVNCVELYRPGTLYSLDGRTGALNWQSASSQIPYSFPALSSDGTVYMGSSSQQHGDHTYALNAADGSVKWIFNFNDSRQLEWSPVLAPDGTVMVGSVSTGSAHTIYALKGEGRPVGRPVLPWHQPINFAFESSAVRFDTPFI